jgi:hypothetical protein
MSVFPLRFVPYGIEYGPCCHAERQENAARDGHGLVAIGVLLAGRRSSDAVRGAAALLGFETGRVGNWALCSSGVAAGRLVGACDRRDWPLVQKAGAMIEDPRDRQQSRRQAITSWLALCLALLLGASAGRTQSVAFINPGKSDEIYWMTATQSMQAVARSLGMTFEVQYAQREPLKTLDFGFAQLLEAKP